MHDRWDDELKRIETELEKQNSEWTRARAALATLGEAEIAVSRESFEELETFTFERAALPLGIRG